MGFECLFYGEEPFEIPSGFELIEENSNIISKENQNLELLKVSDFMNFKSRDKVLEEEGIKSYIDLANAYFLIKCKELQKPRRVREMVIDKYTEILDLITLDDTSNTETSTT